MTILRAVFPYFIVLVFVFYVCLPLFQPGFYTMHDDEQIARLYDLHQSIKAGHIPPRIVPNLGYGYGYPFFNFYPPFAYYTGEIFHLLGFSLILSTKLMLFTGFFLSAVFMYLLSKEFFGKLGGIISSVSYTLLSYKAVDVYVRGAYAEFFSFVPLPLIFLSVWKIGQRKKTLFMVWNSLAVATIILSHNLIALMSVPFILIWLLFILWRSKDKLRFLIEVSASFITGFFVSSYFFIPSYLERGQTLVNILTTELASYSLHFVCAYQLWDSMWGYGGSIASCYDGISFEVGKVQLTLSLLVIFYASRKIFQAKKQLKFYLPIILFGLMLFLSMFFMLRFSKPLWDLLPPFWYVQFPWRFLLFAGFFASFLTGGTVLFSKNKYIRIGLSVFIFLLLIYFSAGKFTPQRHFTATDEDYIKKIRWETSNLAYEYVPRGISTTKSDLNTTKIDIEKNEIASSSATVISGKMNILEIESLPHFKKFDVVVLDRGIFQINTYSLPGWEISLNGKSIGYLDNNKLKLIQIPLEEGSYTIEAHYKNTPPKLYGNTASLLGIIGIVLMAFYIYGKKTS